MGDAGAECETETLEKESDRRAERERSRQKPREKASDIGAKRESE